MMASLIGPVTVLVIGLLGLLWLPVRIRAVWNGEKSAPPIPIVKRSYHLADFAVTDRTFPIFGASLFCLAVWGFLTSSEVVLHSMGVSGLRPTLSTIGAFMLAPMLLFSLVAQAVYSFGRPKFLTPPHLRDEYEVTGRSEGAGATGLAFDFTNEEVQQLLQTDEKLLENLERMVENDEAHLVYEGESESRYAVPDSWWSQIAGHLGYDVPEEGFHVVTVTSTAAYREHVNRVGMLPKVESDGCGTSPFVVEHRSERTETDPIAAGQ